MATLNVQDYGAAGDGTNNDTGAIQSAIDDASAGDTVYFPATDAHYSLRGGQVILYITGPDNLTLKGDGSGTEIRYTGGNSTDENLFLFRIQNGLDGFEMRDMVINGGSENVSGDPVATPLINITSDDPGNQSYLFEDIIVENSYATGMGLNSEAVTINRCTVRDNGKHGIVFRKDASYQDRNVIRNTLVENNSRISGGHYGIDAAYGEWLIEDTVVQNNNDSATKSVDSLVGTFRRVRIDSNNGHSYLVTHGGDGAGDVTFEDVIAENNAQSMRLQKTHNYTVPDGSELVVTNSELVDDQPQIWLLQDATLDASTIYSNRANGQVGLQSSSNSGPSNITNYYHNANDDGPLGSTDNLTIDNREEQDKTDIVGVPTAEEVGAWSGGDTETDSGISPLQSTSGHIDSAGGVLRTN